MKADSLKRLDHLAEILKNLPIEQQKSVISDLENDIKFDPDKIKYLLNKIFDPLELFQELTIEELRLLFHKIDKNVIHSLLMTQSKGKENLIPIIKKLFSKEFIKELSSTKQSFQREKAKEILLDRLFQLIALGKIQYTGIAYLLHPTYCRKENPKTNHAILFQILNPVIAPGEGIKVFIYCPQAGMRIGHLSLQQEKKRFFSDTKWHKGIEFDSYGIFYGEIFPKSTRGLTKLWLTIPGIGEVSRGIIYGNGKSSNLNLDLLSSESNDKGSTFNLELKGKLLPKNDNKLNYTLYCLHCGSPILMSNTQVLEGSFSILLPKATALEHNYDYYLHLKSDQHQSGIILNPPKESESECIEDEVDTIEMYDRSPGDDVVIKFSKSITANILYFSSPSKNEIDKIDNLLNQSLLKLYSNSMDYSNRKLSYLEVSILRNEILVLNDSSQSKDLEYNIDQLINKNELTYIPKKEENIRDIFLSFYILTSKGIKKIGEAVSYITQEPFIYALKPKYIEKDESTEIELAYSVDKPSELTIINGHIENFKIEGKGFINAFFEKNSTLDIILKNGSLEKNYKIEPNPRNFVMNSFEYIKEGSAIDKTKLNYCKIFNNSSEVKNYIIENKVLTYPWGCAEQTSAKLSGYMHVFYKSKEEEKFEEFISIIKDGLMVLKSYIEADGKASLFSNQKSSYSNTYCIINNLKIIKKYKNKLNEYIPEIFILLETLENNTPKHNKLNEKSRMQLPVENEVLMSTLIDLENTSKFLKIKNNKLERNNFNNIYLSLCSIASIISIKLLEKKENSISVLKSSKLVEIKLSTMQKFINLIFSNTYKSKTLEEKKTIIPNAIHMLLPLCKMKYLKSSNPATFDSMSIYNFLDTFEQTIDYKYEESETKIKVLSPYTFIEKEEQLEFVDTESEKPITFENFNLQKGDSLKVNLNKNMYKQGNIFNMYLPSFLEPQETKNIFYSQKENSLSFHPNNNLFEIVLKAIRRGEGSIRMIVEPMQDPADLKTYKFDSIVVS
jgi:hypothetical protein